MSVLTFDGSKCARVPNATISYDDVVIFRNTSDQLCHIDFTNPETFGIYSIGLASQSQIVLPFKEHTSTTYRVEECPTQEAPPPGTVWPMMLDETGTIP